MRKEVEEDSAGIIKSVVGHGNEDWETIRHITVIRHVSIHTELYVY